VAVCVVLSSKYFNQNFVTKSCNLSFSVMDINQASCVDAQCYNLSLESGYLSLLRFAMFFLSPTTLMWAYCLIVGRDHFL